MNDKISSLAVIVAAVLWGMISLYSTPLKLAGISAQSIVAIRSFGAVALLWIFFGIKDRELLKIRLKDIWMFVGTGIISFAFFNLCYFIALEQTTPAVAVILLYTSPVFIIILSAILFKEKITGKKLLALVITIIGSVCVTGVLDGELNGSLIGIICGICSGLFYGLYSIFARFALRKYNTITVTLYTFLFAAIAAAFMADYGELAMVFTYSKIPVYSAMLVVFSTVTPFLLYTKGLDGVETGVAAILANLEPVVGVIIGFKVFGEDPNIIKLTGIVLVLLSAVILNIRSKK